MMWRSQDQSWSDCICYALGK